MWWIDRFGEYMVPSLGGGFLCFCVFMEKVKGGLWRWVGLLL